MTRTARSAAPRPARWAAVACAGAVKHGLLMSGVPSYAIQQSTRGQMPG